MSIFDNKASEMVVEEFYNMALHDYNKGSSVEVLEANIKVYEDLELYLPCAGIKKAVDEIKAIERILYEVDSMIYNETLIDKITEVDEDERGDN
jgi:hypothetical protein